MLIKINTWANIINLPMYKRTIASYIEYVYSLDDSDPVFIKLGKNKKEILNLYITTLRGKYADIIKGIYYIASGQYETGVKMTYNSFCALINKYSSSFDVSKEDINDADGIISGALSLLQKFDIYYIQLPNAVKINDIGIKTLWEMRTGSWRFYH